MGDHTPLPWVNDAPGCVGKHYPAGGRATVCTMPYETPEGVANAALIVRAVNNHEALLAACKVYLAKHAAGMYPPYRCECEACGLAREAIAGAGG